MRRVVLAALLLAGCSTVDRVEHRFGLNSRPPPSNATLDAIMSATPRSCPNGRTLAGANHEAFGPQHDVTVEDVATTPVAGDPHHVVRLRRIVIAPGGVIAWHTHDAIQGMAMIVSGEATEIRNSCMDPIVYRAGDIALEDATTAHGWRNDGDVPVVVLTSHVVAVD